MPSRTSLLFSAIILLFFSACKPSREHLTTNINGAVEGLKKGYNAGKPDSSLVLNAINAFDHFVQTYPADSMAPYYLIKGGDYYRIMKQYDKAMTKYTTVEKNYPDSKACAYSIFVQGFVYENELHDLPKAKERYETFIKRFPNDKLAEDARHSINNLGVSPEELVRRFEEKNKGTLDSNSTKPDTMAHNMGNMKM